MDEHILKRIRQGDKTAFAVLVKRFQKPLFSYLGKMGLSQTLAEEVAQEAFIRVWQSRQQFDPDRSAISTWLFTIAFTLCSIPLVALVALYLPAALTLPLLLLSVGVSLSIWIYGVINAWKAARRQRNYILQNWQLPGVYVLISLTAVLFILPGMTQFIRGHQLESFRIPSASMEPSVMNGDFLFADKRYNCPLCRQSVQRGDIAIFVYPNNRTRYYIKRIIGLPGDRIRIAAQQVFVNGQSLMDGEIQQQGEYNIIA